MAQRYSTVSTHALRISVGVVFTWFGVLKFFPAASPAERVAGQAMTRLTFGLIPAHVSMPLLATLETLIGLALVTGLLLRMTLALFFTHMAGVFASLVLLPQEMWHSHGVVPTLEGQYVIKNIVLVAACLHVATDDRA